MLGKRRLHTLLVINAGTDKNKSLVVSTRFHHGPVLPLVIPFSYQSHQEADVSHLLNTVITLNLRQRIDKNAGDVAKIRIKLTTLAKLHCRYDRDNLDFTLLIS